MKVTLSKNVRLMINILIALILATLFITLVLSRVSESTDILGNKIIVLDNVAFHIFNRDIYFYALCIMTGIILAYLYATYTARRIGFDEDKLFNGFIIGTIIGIIGAKVWYALFSGDPIGVLLGVFKGDFAGLAIHGAVIFAGVFAYFYCKKNKLDMLKLAELLFPGFLIGQICGRWGNFFNKEAHGGPIADTVAASRAFLEKLPIPKFVVDQMYIDGKYMHPTFLYESVWNIIGLLVIVLTRKYSKKYWYGDALLIYMVWYGIGRFAIESIRTDALWWNVFGIHLRIAQVISLLFVVLGVTLFILRRVYKFKPISFMELVEINEK